MKIVFATNNKHKLDEIRAILGDGINVLSLSDIGCNVDIPENGKTLEENALQKALYVADNYGLACFADDTGLEVDALGGEPGIYSARYADDSKYNLNGCSHNSEANMAKLLDKLKSKDNRKARFRTVIALIDKHSLPSPLLFEGIVEGSITREKHGSEGFGYDPVFVPLGYYRTFAELGDDIKNTISHRAKAVKKLADFLLR